MKTADKMAKWVHAIENGYTMHTKSHASIMVSGTTIYSYGTHYPLLFRIPDKHGTMIWVRNNGGYSATTAKHIAYAGPHRDIDAPIGGTRTSHEATTPAGVIKALTARIESLAAEMASKKRKDTQVYKALESDHKYYSECLSRLV